MKKVFKPKKTYSSVAGCPVRDKILVENGCYRNAGCAVRYVTYHVPNRNRSAVITSFRGKPCQLFEPDRFFFMSYLVANPTPFSFLIV
jgi:hypothetical protein